MSKRSRVPERIFLNAFIAEAMLAPELPEEPLTWVLRHPELQRGGFWLEFGVGYGSTLRVIVAAEHSATVIGFDSFWGLPQPWRDGFPAGTFSTDGRPPSVNGAKMVVGLFEETLPDFAPIGGLILPDVATLVHIDCDLYESTKTVLKHIVPILAAGAFIVFDELLDYPGFDEHEIRALFEAREAGFAFDWIGRRGEKVVIQTQPNRNACSVAMGSRRAREASR